LTIDPGAPTGAVPLTVDANGPEVANAAATIFFQVGVGGDPYADEVVSVTYGAAAGFGQSRLPGVVLGPPKGAGALRQGLDVLTLGDGGSITLAFTDNRVVDGPGPDLAVFENAFAQGGDPSVRFIELARVEVSANGVDFFEFPSSVNPALPLGDPARYSGFAGVGCVDPLGEPVAPEAFACGDGSGQLAGIGGDSFDLQDLGLSEARYVRVTDVGGDPADSGDAFAGGFDLDAVAALHSAAPN
ncbi:MAG: hypothetical protein KC466_11935, partial [Myxococcales bacterium]|nr:hypothetical protein [Myxococcales bacterium]